MEENFSMEWVMEWKKIASMEYGKIVFLSIPYHALFAGVVWCSRSGFTLHFAFFHEKQSSKTKYEPK